MLAGKIKIIARFIEVGQEAKSNIQGILMGTEHIATLEIHHINSSLGHK